jgi:predicted dienelactone hydrolase
LISSPYRRLLFRVAVGLWLTAGQTRVAGQAYDPLAISDQRRPASLDFTIRDEARRRDIPVRVYLPAGKTAAPVVVFSHGLGGSRKAPHTSATIGRRAAMCRCFSSTQER